MSQNSLKHLHTIMNLYSFIYDVKEISPEHITIDEKTKVKLKIYKDQDEFFQNSWLPCIKMLYSLGDDMSYQEYSNNLKLGVDIMRDYKHHLKSETWISFFDIIFEPFLKSTLF